MSRCPPHVPNLDRRNFYPFFQIKVMLIFYDVYDDDDISSFHLLSSLKSTIIIIIVLCNIQ